ARGDRRILVEPEDEQRQAHRQQDEQRGDGEEPHAAAGVDHLADLDPDLAAERHAGTAQVDRGVGRGRAHAGTPSVVMTSRWFEDVSCRNISSRPALSDSRSSTRATPASAAAWPTSSGEAVEVTASPATSNVSPAAVSADSRAAMSRARTRVPATRSSSSLVPLATIRPLPMTMRSSAMIWI